MYDNVCKTTAAAADCCPDTNTQRAILEDLVRRRYINKNRHTYKGSVSMFSSPVDVSTYVLVSQELYGTVPHFFERIIRTQCGHAGFHLME